MIGGRPGPSLGVTSQRGSNCPAKASAASRVPKAHRRTGLPGSDAIHTVAMVPLSCTRIERMYLHDVAMLTEAPSPCPQGHTYRPDTYIVGWDPCLCVAGRTGHRTYCCIHRHAAGRPAMRAYRVQFVGQGLHRAEPPVRSAERAAGRVNDRRADRGWSRRGIRASSQRAVVIRFLTHVGHDRSGELHGRWDIAAWTEDCCRRPRAPGYRTGTGARRMIWGATGVVALGSADDRAVRQAEEGQTFPRAPVNLGPLSEVILRERAVRGIENDGC